MAYPDKIAEMIMAYRQKIAILKVLAVADAERWEELCDVVPDLVEGQIARANVILLNKVDTLEPAMVGYIHDSVRKLNPAASLYPVSAHDGIDSETWNKVVMTN